jgi:hypothetical protein
VSDLYVSVGPLSDEATPPVIRSQRTGDRVQVSIGLLTVLLPIGIARGLRDDLIGADLGDPT